MYLQAHIYKNIPVSFDFITTSNQGVFLCSAIYILLITEHNGIIKVFYFHQRMHYIFA
jgi:hypothetical protein